jgi:hypothetical protein
MPSDYYEGCTPQRCEVHWALEPRGLRRRSSRPEFVDIAARSPQIDVSVTLGYVERCFVEIPSLVSYCLRVTRVQKKPALVNCPYSKLILQATTQ